MIVVDKMAFSYDGTQDPAKYLFDFTISCNSKVGVFGANGSGKSTLFLLLAGLLKPTHGTISIQDTDVTKLRPHKRNMSVMFQNYNLFEHLTIQKNIELAHAGDAGQHREKIDHYLNKFGIFELRKKKPAELSGGERQKAALIRSMITHMPVLLLDEPLSAMDPTWRDKAMRFILDDVQQYSQTLFVVAHNPFEIAQHLNAALFIHAGRIYYAGPINAFLRSTDVVIKEFLQIKKTAKILEREEEYAV